METNRVHFACFTAEELIVSVQYLCAMHTSTADQCESGTNGSLSLIEMIPERSFLVWHPGKSASHAQVAGKVTEPMCIMTGHPEGCKDVSACLRPFPSKCNHTVPTPSLPQLAPKYLLTHRDVVDPLKDGLCQFPECLHCCALVALFGVAQFVRQLLCQYRLSKFCINT